MNTREGHPPQEGVERIVCASMMATTEGVYGQMEEIRAASLARNQPDSLHAVLASQSGWFVHWVEGPAAAARAVVRRIARDTRNHSQVVLHHSHGPRILPTPWNMLLLPGPDSVQAFGSRVQQLRLQLVQGWQHPPTSVLRRLLTPLRLPEAEGLPDPDSFHRMGVCSSDSMVASAFVRWVAEQVGQPVRHRRLAIEEGPDVGMDTVDFLVAGQACRLNGLPWQGMQSGLLRVYVPDWRQLMLLLSGTSRANELLVQRICTLCAAVDAAPELLGMASDMDTHLMAAQAARDFGLNYIPLGLADPQDYAAVWACVQERLRELGPPALTGSPVTEILSLD